MALIISFFVGLFCGAVVMACCAVVGKDIDDIEEVLPDVDE